MHSLEGAGIVDGTVLAPHARMAWTRWGTAVCFVGLLAGCDTSEAPETEASSSSTSGDDQSGTTPSTSSGADEEDSASTSSDSGSESSAGDTSTGGTTGSLQCGEFGCGSSYGDDCQDVACVEGECVYGENYEDGTPCAYDDGFDFFEGLCRQGTCEYDCYTDEDCSGSSPCEAQVCDFGRCIAEPVEGPAAEEYQTPGDCRSLTCSRGEEELVPDPDDAVDDRNECTADACDGTVPTHDPVEPGVECGDGGVCNDVGECVEPPAP